METERELTKRERAYRAIQDGEVTEIEATILKWQWSFFGDGGFWSKLWPAIVHADEKNLERLELAFPTEINALRLWRTTWIGESLRERNLL